MAPEQSDDACKSPGGVPLPSYGLVVFWWASDAVATRTGSSDGDDGDDGGGYSDGDGDGGDYFQYGKEGAGGRKPDRRRPTVKD